MSASYLDNATWHCNTTLAAMFFVLCLLFNLLSSFCVYVLSILDCTFSDALFSWRDRWWPIVKDNVYLVGGIDGGPL